MRSRHGDGDGSVRGPGPDQYEMLSSNWVCQAHQLSSGACSSSELLLPLAAAAAAAPSERRGPARAQTEVRALFPSPLAIALPLTIVIVCVRACVRALSLAHIIVPLSLPLRACTYVCVRVHGSANVAPCVRGRVGAVGTAVAAGVGGAGAALLVILDVVARA